MMHEDPSQMSALQRVVLQRAQYFLNKLLMQDITELSITAMLHFLQVVQIDS